MLICFSDDQSGCCNINILFSLLILISIEQLKDYSLEIEANTLFLAKVTKISESWVYSLY